MNVVFFGFFDFVIFGYMDVLMCVSYMFEQVIVIVMYNVCKQGCYFFILDEWFEILCEVIVGLFNVWVDSFSGLLVDYVVQQGCSVIVCGLWVVSDYEYEFQIVYFNCQIGEVEIVFIMVVIYWSFVSSFMVKEIVSYGGKIYEMVFFVSEVVLWCKFVEVYDKCDDV